MYMVKWGLMLDYSQISDYNLYNSYTVRTYQYYGKGGVYNTMINCSVAKVKQQKNIEYIVFCGREGTI